MLLSLTNYRCFDSLTVRIPQGNFIIKDLNGSGKTSILSAIYAIGTGLPWPGSKFANYLKEGCQYFGISTADQELFLNGKITPSGRITTKYSNPNSSKEVFLTYQPGDNLWLFQSRSNKLATLDQIISQVSLSHNDNTTRLDKVCNSKLSLIKHYNQTGDHDITILKFLNDQILELSIAIWQSRHCFLTSIHNSLPEYSSLILSPIVNWQIEWEVADIDGKKQKIRNCFRNCFADQKNPIRHPELDSESSTIDILNSKINLSKLNQDKLFQKEILLEKILFGAQRDDFSITHNSQRIEQVLSRGEMRLLVLFLKKLSTKNSSTYPNQFPNAPTTWLLDDVFNELDDQREQMILDNIFSKSDRIIATGTRCNLKNLKSYKVQELTCKN